MAQFSEALGSISEVTVNNARVRYHETGNGPPIVFVHGILVNAIIWRKVVPSVRAAGYRCIAADWPLGSHSVPVPGADLRPPAVADLIASFLAKLDLEDVTIVANDTGGALTQILMTRNPGRIARVVLTPSDSYERFFPSFLKLLPPLARVPGSMRLVTESLRFRALHPALFGLLAKRPIPRDVVDSCLLPSRQNSAIRYDLRRFAKGVNQRYTLEAVRSFPYVNAPVLLAWASEDKLFPLRQAQRLAQELPNATLKTIDDSYTFVPEDQPEQLADMIVEFTRQHATS